MITVLNWNSSRKCQRVNDAFKREKDKLLLTTQSVAEEVLYIQRPLWYPMLTADLVTYRGGSRGGLLVSN